MRTVSIFPTPSFLRGAARVVDLAGLLDRGVYRASATPEQSDLDALLGDWQALAADMEVAFDQTGRRVAEARHRAEAEE